MGDFARACAGKPGESVSPADPLGESVDRDVDVAGWTRTRLEGLRQTTILQNGRTGLVTATVDF